MQKPFLIITGSIVALAVLGTGALLATENWLGKRLTQDLETELTAATGVEAAVRQTDVRLLQQQVVFNDLSFDNVPGFTGENLLTIRQVQLTQPSLQGKPLQVAIANLEGVVVNIEGDLNDLPDPRMIGALPNVNLAQLLEQWVDQEQATATDANGQPITTFEVDQLTVENIQVNLNLTVPWQGQAIAHTITVPNVTLTNVNNLNISEQLADRLGPALTEELSLFFMEEILPASLQYIQESFPGGLDLSGLELPEGVTLPEQVLSPRS